jgi:hypothetical protein
MRRTAAILVLVAVVSLLGTSDVRAGSAGAPAGKTTGSSVVATIVIDVTGGFQNPGKGLTSIRIQRSGSSAAALFDSGLINTWVVSCNDVVGDINGRFVGLLNGWVPGSVLTSLLGPLGGKAAITDTDYASCTSVDNGVDQVVGSGAEGGVRQILSFTAVIQFEK